MSAGLYPEEYVNCAQTAMLQLRRGSLKCGGWSNDPLPKVRWPAAERCVTPKFFAPNLELRKGLYPFAASFLAAPYDSAT
ncbi:hypothetical protein NDU88_005592 [Pleurodeles waltl]|uniref:Uncharacterized protein n=1 Tax=Pleurodeles waltl TaxID=8319 RepID=A0AAV7UKK4_PLEWA|nr:hypothetical protein NDU88_005592 [Pleurodeles waltl]